MSHHFPEPKRAAVERALSTAFGTTEVDGATPLTGGLSGALIYRIRVGGIAYLLRIEGARDAFRDPSRWYGCMAIAAGALLAPRVRYADAQAGVAIMEFIPERSLTLDYRGTRTDLVVELGQTLRALHAAPAFPPLVNYLDGMDALIARFQGFGMLASSATAEVFGLYAELRAVYRTAPHDLVSSHNDLNPRNILYDGARLWLIDWESAFLADRYVDLAALANVFASDADAEDVLLRTYFGASADEESRARLYLMRQVNHLFYAMIFLNGVAEERPGEALGGLKARSLAEIHQALGNGDFALETREGRIEYGLSRLGAALDGLRSERFAEAVAVLKATRPAAG
jgi:aminoglycoside phosphotransferase (APT) family kinase protein